MECQTNGFYQFFGWYGKQLIQLGLRRFEPPHHKDKLGILRTSQAPIWIGLSPNTKTKYWQKPFILATMYLWGLWEGSSTNVTIPINLGNDLCFLEICLHRPKEISCYERALQKPLHKGSHFKHSLVSLYMVPQQCLTKCVYKWNYFLKLVNGSFFLTVAINKYWVNVCLTNESQKTKWPSLRPIYHGSRKKIKTYHHFFLI